MGINTGVIARFYRLYWIHIVYFCFAWLFALVYFRSTHDIEVATLEMQTSFTAFKSVQLRVLIPSVVHYIKDFFPIPLRHLYLIISFGFTLSLLYSFRQLIRLFIPDRTADLYSLVLIYTLMYNYAALNPLYYPSDIPAIFFFTVGVILILKRRWVWYYILFPIAVLNRESIAFLSIALVFLLYKKVPLVQLGIHAVVQCIIWLGIRLTLYHIFIDNPGHTFRFTYDENFWVLVSIFKGNLPLLARLLIFGLIWTLIPYGWKEIPSEIKRLFLVFIPFVIVIFTIGCFIDEIREYCEMNVVITAPAIFGLRKMLRDIFFKNKSASGRQEEIAV
jgi:hypothetical protein